MTRWRDHFKGFDRAIYPFQTATRTYALTKDTTIARLLPLSIIAWLATCVVDAEAAQFSADIVSVNANGEPAAQPGRLYVSDDKVRIETPDVAGGYFVVDETSNAAFFVRPAKEIFMEARQSSLLTQILISVDPADPCRKWQAMAVSAGAAAAAHGGQWRCEQIGEEIIDGRKTIGYSMASPMKKQGAGWIDLELKILLRTKTEGGASIELKNIQEGPQPASLFEIPASFQKFDPQALLEIVKKSDAWVERVQ
jgi:hypothetical protein